MTEYFLSLRPLEPLRIGTVKPSEGYLDTRQYIPGSILRGSLAEWLKLQGRAGEIPQAVQKVRFGNFFPSPFGSVWALPFPMTALECKLEGGFRNFPSTSKEKPGHGIRDSLLVALAYSELEKQGARFPVPMLLRCTYEKEDGEKCGARMDRVGGFYAQLSGGWQKVKIKKAVQTKVALSRFRRAAQEKMLYRIVGIRPEGYFVGRVWAQDTSVVNELREAVEQIGVGAMTTRGFGKAELKEVEVQVERLEDRLRIFNEKLSEVWGSLADFARKLNGEGTFHNEPTATYFSVDLLSPAILFDPNGLPTLKLWLNFNGQRLEPIFWATQPTFIGGFSPAWGLPKPAGLGAAMGSVYVFKVKKGEDREKLVSWLESIESCGVGRRTDEGFGEILICHPFHREVMPV